jgi:phosphoglycerate dehydrogenase-like enzyme
MRQSTMRATLLVAGCFAASASAREVPRADPAAEQVIQELGLLESAAPVRELPGWRAPKVFLLPYAGPFDIRQPGVLDSFKSAAPGVEFVIANSSEEMIAKAPSADAIFGGDFFVCDDKVLAAAKHAHWVAIYSAGVEECLGKKVLEQPGVIVTNLRAVAGPVMAEHSIALMFALARSLQVSVARQTTGEGWNRNFSGSQPQALTGKTLLVAGLGGIGTEVARRAHALGMKVIATRASSHEGPDFVSYVGLADELPKLIGEADVVLSALPLIPSTTNLFDAKMFARMKKTAYFINVGRGGSVVTDDLAKALNDGVIAGAGLDVTEPEPLPRDHPLWKARNIIITPHMSAQSDLGSATRQLILREQIRRYAAGDKLVSVVDFRKGY